LPDRIPQPIKTSAHGAIDYGFAAVNLTAPSLLGLSGPAAAIPRAFALMQGGLNAVTRQPYAVRPLVSLRAHGWIEAATIPALGAVAAATGALDSPRGRLYFGAMGAALATVYALTDWNDPPGSGSGSGSEDERTGVTIGGDQERVGAFLRDPEAVRQFAADGWDGSFELRAAPGERGTEVFADASRDDLRRAKQLFESGEIITAENGVHGRRGAISSALPDLDTGS
jgi:hypothetical protein